VEGECLLWDGAVDRHGYGRTSALFKEHSGAITRLAHRMAYTVAKGPIPAGMQLDHLCEVRLCVNPDHLEPVTQAENQRRRRERRTRCKQGHSVTGDNVYEWKNKQGHIRKGCRLCRAAASSRFERGESDRR
jgi:HNH endonuclease